MNESDSWKLLAVVRSKHGPTIERLRLQALGQAGTTTAIASENAVHGAPSIAARSLLDRTLDIRLLATHNLVAQDATLAGTYPTGSKLLFISVSAREAGTRTIKPIDPDEADAWCRALAPDGLEDYSIRLGQIATSPSNALHYRQIVGPDNCICVIDERDQDSMRATAFYI